MTTEANQPTGPVARDPINPAIEVPVYAGGEGPVEPPQYTPEDRGDVIEPPKKEETPPENDTPEGEEGEDKDTTTDDAPDVDEGEGEGEETPSEPKKTDDRPRNEKGQFIPRSRFNEVNEERKRLAQELEQLKSEKEAAAAVEEDAYDFDAKEKEYMNLLLDGKLDEAAALRSEIRAAEQAMYEKVAAQKSAETTQQMSLKERIEEIAHTYASALPQFDPESDDYNDELMADVQDIYRGALESGRYADPAIAFKSSIEKALKLHGLSMPQDNKDDKETETAAQPAEGKGRKKPPVRTAQKRVEAIIKQPPDLNGVGTSGAPETHATIKVNELTDAEFAKLPEATKRRLRGDFV